MTACVALGLLIESLFYARRAHVSCHFAMSLWFVLCVIYVCFCGIVFMVYTIVAEKRVPVQ